MYDTSYIDDLAANRLAFSMSNVLRPEFEDNFFDDPGLDEIDRYSFMGYSFRDHKDHYVNMCNNLEYINGVPVLPPYPNWYIETEGTEFIWEEDDEP